MASFAFARLVDQAGLMKFSHSGNSFRNLREAAENRVWKIDRRRPSAYVTGLLQGRSPAACREKVMRVANSMKTLKKRHRACRLIKRKGRTYVINKENPRFKARQG